MIHNSDVMPMLLAACPSFGPAWDAYRSEKSFAPGLLYIDLGEFAVHVIALWKAGRTAELGPVFDAIERLHVEGDDYVREAPTIGLLEGLQNVTSHSDFDAEVFHPLLGPESTRWWVALNRFWAGEIPYVRAE
jgi:hypothetical protein